MSDIKLKAASGGGSISIKGPSSAGSDTDFLDTSGNLNVTGTSTFGGQLNVNTNSIVTSGWGAIKAPENQGFEINSIGSPNKYMIQAKGGGPVYLYNNGTLQCETSTVGLKFPSGKGIDFSATSGTGDSELLDDYERGSWNMTVTPGSGSYTYGYGNTGYYTKVGNLVHVHAWVHLTTSSPSGSISWGGLPFTVKNTNRRQRVPIMGYGWSSISNASQIVAMLSQNGTGGSFGWLNDSFASITTVTAGNLGQSAEIYLNLTYECE